MEEDFKETAKAYILYRDQRRVLRETKSKEIEAHIKLKNLSLNAVKVLARRYLQRDDEDRITETPDQLFRRVAKAVAEVDLQHGKTKKEVRELEEIFYNLMTDQIFMPNSPTLFNAGTGNNLTLSACFVLPVKDDLGEIFETLKHMAIVQKAGGGTGFAFSHLRPKGDIVHSTGGRASGPVSFMKVYNAATEAIKQGGKRRGANMGVLRVDHPDILDFINTKEDENALTNFNISVAANDSFMEALEKNEKIPLINPRNDEKVDEIDARTIFDHITSMAWKNGDPGMIWLDTINVDNPVSHLGEIEGTNPCGELPLLSNESCNLGHINLEKFAEDDEVIWDKLETTVKHGVHFLDNVITLNPYPIPEIEEATKRTRKIGPGVM
jgi:ribonucleoside-diphosphate reductase alpha chain